MKYTNDSAQIYKKIKEIEDHIKANETTYQNYIKNVENFIVSFLSDVNFRVQKFFLSCSQVSSVEEIEFRFIDFSVLLDNIEMNSYHVTVPGWYQRALLEKREKKTKAKEQDTDPNRKKRALVENKNPDSLCKLKPKEYINKVFHKDIIQDLNVPKLNGKDICLKYHCLGKCDNKCQRSDSHVELKGNNLIKFRDYVIKAKEKFHAKASSANTDATAPNQENVTEEGQ